MAPYDPDLRRDTPLARKLIARIRRDEVIDIGEFFRVCMWDPEHGYYATRDVIGLAGDFVTAPEISQVFGELIGLWSAVVWQQMGSPAKVVMVELGPGRGTLMMDALRGACRVPGFAEAVSVTLYEGSERLKAQQQATLARSSVPITWVDDSFEPSSAPTILIANEFVDALAPRQFIKTGVDEWRWRAVVVDGNGHLQFGVPELRTFVPDDLDARWPAASIGSSVTYHDRLLQFRAIAPGNPFAALFIDYGHSQSALGDTLQAVRKHTYEHPLTSPGEADLSAQVDFSVLADEWRAAGFAIDGPVPQADFLGSLGIVERGRRLMTANPGQANAIETGIARLMAPNGMGSRFKAIGIRSAGLPPLPGFETHTHIER